MTAEMPKQLLAPMVVAGVKLIAGSGAIPARVMFVTASPTNIECRDSAPFTSKESMFLRNRASEAGIDPEQCYWTYAVKYATFGNKPPKAADISACRDMLEDEIARVNPDVIVPTGTQAFMATMGTGYKITAYQHSFIESARFPGRTLYPMPSPGYIRRSPQLEYQYSQAFTDLRDRLAGVVRSKQEPRPIEVEIVADFERGIATHMRTDTGEVFRERTLTQAEKEKAQGSLFGS